MSELGVSDKELISSGLSALVLVSSVILGAAVTVGFFFRFDVWIGIF